MSCGTTRAYRYCKEEGFQAQFHEGNGTKRFKNRHNHGPSTSTQAKADLGNEVAKIIADPSNQLGKQLAEVYEEWKKRKRSKHIKDAKEDVKEDIKKNAKEEVKEGPQQEREMTHHNSTTCNTGHVAAPESMIQFHYGFFSALK